MSTLPPGPPHNEWDMPPGGSPPAARGRAAMLVWITGAVEMVFFGTCAVGIACVPLIPMGQFLHEMGNQPGVPADAVRLFYRLAWAIALAVAVTGVLPGMIYVLLGFGVRSGRRVPIYAALLMAITQMIVFGLLLITSVLSALAQLNPQALTINVLILGTPLLLLGFTAYWLLRARNALPDPNDEIWNFPQNPNSPPPPPPGAPPPPPPEAGAGPP